MSTYTDASLIVTPNGYKAGKLYSLKPTDGTGDLSVTRATTATRVNSSGLIESVESGVPRLDYTNGSCPSILVEPQRTNLLLRSEEFDNAYWVKSNSSVIANAVIAPDGNLTADKFVANSGSNAHFLNKSNTVLNSIYTHSCFFKSSEYNYAFLRVNGVGTFPYVIYNLLTEELVSDSGNKSKIENFGNGWFRISLTTDFTSTNQATIISFLPSSGYTLNASNIPIWDGDGISGGFIWGAQLEAGSNATSYIPTVASSVTRNADVISKTGISSLIGQTEGTLFVDVNYKVESVSKNYLNLGTSTSNYIAIVAKSNNKIGMEVLNSGVQVNAPSTSTYSTNQRLKIAMTYKLNDFKLYVNGVLQATDTSGTVPAKAEFYLGSYGNGTNQATDGINSAVLWKTALTDQECINLTTI